VSTRNANGPLRRVTQRTALPVPGFSRDLPRDVLECGHTHPPKQDLYGETFPTRRRCWKCRDGVPGDLEDPAPAAVD